MTRKFSLLHPVLFALYPAVFVYLKNQKELSFQPVGVSIALVVAALVAITGLLWRLFDSRVRSADHAALLASACWLGVYLYNEIFVSLGHTFTHRIFLPSYLLLFGGALWALSRWKERPVQLSQALFMASALPFLFLGLESLSTKHTHISQNVHTTNQGPVLENAPDVYYIVLDAHASPETLKRDYQLGEVTHWLDRSGFKVVPRSRSNYSQTTLSIPATFKMDYHRGIAGIAKREADQKLMSALLNAPTFQEFRSRGYEMITISALHVLSGIAADHKYECKRQRFAYLDLYVDRTIFSVAKKYMGLDYWLGSQRKSAICTLERLEFIAGRKERPKFVYAHLLLPHRPFLFGPNGEEKYVNLNEDQIRYRSQSLPNYASDYRDQTVFLHKELERIVQKIRAESLRPPIILIQADHGPNYGPGWKTGTWENPNAEILEEKMSIINAVLGPKALTDQFYPGMTLVNTFPTLLNHLFGTPYPHREDKSFYAPNADAPYRFIEVPEDLFLG